MAIRSGDKGLVTVFGGTGFLGRHVVRALLKRGYRVRAAVRRPDLAGHLQPLGLVGWVQPVQANLRVRWSVDRAVEDADAVINLVAILNESGRQRFAAVNAFGARAVAEATRAAGIERMVHVSAIGADADSPSAYGRSKAQGEAAVRETLPNAVIMRPSIMFGPEDHFFNLFAGLARIMPALPLFGGGHTQFQPVFVGDVAAAIADTIEGKAEAGATYEFGGPEIKTFRQCMEIMLSEIERSRPLVSVPWSLGMAAARIAQTPAEAAGHRRPAPPASNRQCRLRRGDRRRPHACRLRHRSGRSGGDPTVLSGAFPGPRPVRAPADCLTGRSRSVSAPARRNRGRSGRPRRRPGATRQRTRSRAG